MAIDGKTRATAWASSGKHTFFGKAAVKEWLKDNQKDGKDIALTATQKYIIELEGYVPWFYKDTKGIVTYGVGQTGEWIDKGFIKAYDHHVKVLKGLVSTESWKDFPDDVKKEMTSYVYRGDISEGYNITKALKENPPNYKAAYLAASNWDEIDYYGKNAKEGIKTRKLAGMYALAQAAGLTNENVDARVIAVAKFRKANPRPVGQTPAQKKEWNKQTTIKLAKERAAELGSLENIDNNSYAANNEDVDNMTKILNQNLPNSVEGGVHQVSAEQPVETQAQYIARINGTSNETAAAWLSGSEQIGEGSAIPEGLGYSPGLRVA